MSTTAARMPTHGPLAFWTRGMFAAGAIAALLFATANANARQADGKASGPLVLGKAGSRFISEEEFIRRFELIPGLYRHRASRLNEEKMMVMYSLIAEKLLAQEAEAQGVDRDSAAMEGIGWLTGILARDELYREEIAGKVEVSAAEVRQGMRDAVRKLHVLYLFFPDGRNADAAASRLAGGDLGTYAPDPGVAFMRDTVTLVWGAAEPDIEKAAFALSPGRSSPVVLSSRGYVLLGLLSQEPNRFYADMKPGVLSERVRDHIRLTKEKARFDAYLRETLLGKQGYARAAAVKAIAIAMSGELERSGGDSTYVLGSGALERLEQRIQPLLRDTAMVAGERAFSVREVLERFSREGFSSPSRDALAVAAGINNQCRIWVQQELLAQEAIRRGLESAPEVRKQLDEWREAYLAQLMRARIEDSITVSDADVYKFRELNGDPLPTPEVRVRCLTAATVEQMRLALQEMHRGMPLAEAVRRFSGDPVERADSGATGWFRITERPPIGEIASQLAPGQTYGPFPLGQGIVLFQLLEKRDPAAKDSSVADSKRRTADDLARLLRKQALDRFIAISAAKRGYSIFEDRLMAIKVSPVPMMSFRVIGFGGRLFAAPMLPRMFEWINMPVPSLSP